MTSNSPEKRIFTDNLGRQVIFNFPPQRIVSLVPSITELLFDLGLREKIIGITRFCVLPKNKTGQLTKVGGTKDFSVSKIVDLQPGLVIANKEENTKDLVLNLAERVPVFVTDVYDFESALAMINVLGQITGFRRKAQQIIQEIQKAFANLPKQRKFQKAIYLIWKNPYMTVSEKTFINAMMNKASFENVFASKKDNYPVVTTTEIQNSDAEVILLADEPYHFQKKHIAEFQNLLPDAKVYIVDGKSFTWYGSRMRQAAEYFSTLR